TSCCRSIFNSSDHRYFIKYFNTFLNPSMRKSYKIKFMINNRFHEFSIHARVSSSSIHLLHDFALTGGGIVCLPTIVARESLLDKKLTPVLIDYPLPNYGLRAVFPSNSRNLTKIRCMIDFLVEKLDLVPEWDQQLIEKGYLSPMVKLFQ
ncbi:LysR substrate-binding domain-containing protein, partial [Acinetobacter baumannii]